MKPFSTLALLLIVVLWSSCRSDFETIESTGNLEFSKDTVFLDTIFSNISSATYSLKVYNRSNEDIHIPEIKLKKGEASAYRLNVDGLPGKTFEDIEILAKDSIYIFIETTVNLQQPNQKEFLYEDNIQFQSNAHLQEIPVLTLVKDAVFLYPDKDQNGTIETIVLGTNEKGDEEKVQGFYLRDDQLIFTNDKAYIIYGFAAVPSGKILTIEPGARIHFHAGSGILVSEGASLKVNGEFSADPEKLENEVIFQGDRLNADFQNLPGQWGAIWLREGSIDNVINYATIKNAGIGLLVEGNKEASPILQIKNSKIYNSAINGLRSTAAKVYGENLVINNSGQSSLRLIGGNYIFKHATLVNYWQQGYREYPAVYIENFQETETGLQSYDLELAKFSNCIIYGNEKTELLFNRNETTGFNILFENCLIKFDETSYLEDPYYDFSNAEFYADIIINENPFFWNPLENDFSLQSGSPAIDKGNLSTAFEVPFDIIQVERTVDPDLGAYEWTAPELNN